MNKKTIAIIGTRGIPNLYGGFEQFAEYVSVGLVKMGYKIIVYNPHFHPYKKDIFNGVEVVKKYCPEGKIGAAAHIIYDWLCLRDALKKKVDVVLELGYQSSAISMLICKTKTTKIVTNMDGMEWMRQKWSPAVKKFTKWSERIAVEKSDVLVSDNQGIHQYFQESYGVDSYMIPYGAEVFDDPNSSVLEDYGLLIEQYNLLIARLEPENNIVIILDGYVHSGDKDKFIVVGSHDSEYGRFLKKRYINTNIEFIGGVYDIEQLNNLRYFAKFYFHGHSVGGTNPSLLEAMASQAMIVAHNNIFNISVLEENALYFSSENEIASILDKSKSHQKNRKKYISNNLEKINKEYRWDLIIEQYAHLFDEL